MNKEIEEIIRKELPQQVGDILRKRLNELEEIEKECNNLKTALIEKKDTIILLENELDALKQYKNISDKLVLQEKHLIERESKLNYDEVLYKLNVEQDKTQFCKDVALGLVRNTTYRKEILSSESIPFIDEYGNRTLADKHKNSTETNTKQ